MIRDEVYRQYADRIEGLYTDVKRSGDAMLEPRVFDTKAHLTDLCRKHLGLSISSADVDDLFSPSQKSCYSAPPSQPFSAPPRPRSQRRYCPISHPRWTWTTAAQSSSAKGS
jgi:hypothetical protein